MGQHTDVPWYPHATTGEIKGRAKWRLEGNRRKTGGGHFLGVGRWGMGGGAMAWQLSRILAPFLGTLTWAASICAAV